MEFQLDNFGKVGTAKVRLDGITVIAGQNGSGKSTISRALMTWCSVIRRMEALTLEERLKSMRDAVNEILKTHDMPPIRFRLQFDTGFTVKFLVPEVWCNPEMVSRLLRRSIDSFRRRYDSDIESSAERIVALYDKIAPAVEQVAKKNSMEYVPGIIEESFDQAFDGDLASMTEHQKGGVIRYESDSGKVRMCEFIAGRLISMEGMGSNHVPLSFYLEPLHLLDLCLGGFVSGRLGVLAENRYQAGEEDWRRLLHQDADMSDWSMERKRKHEELVRELDELMELIRGQMVNVDQTIRFYDMDVGHDVSIRNVASGAKSMALLARGIKSGIVAPDSLLIIDEPESNLHPAWQISFAKFLALLHSRFGFKVFINTHSPYFMRAIDVFSRDLGCSREEKSFYRMVPDGKSYRTEDVTDCINEAFKDMYLPLERLM